MFMGDIYNNIEILNACEEKMRYLFWNTNNKEIDNYLINIVNDYNPAIIALAEYNRSSDNLIHTMKHRLNKDYVELPPLACRVRIIVNEKLTNYIKHCHDHTNYTIKIVPYNSYYDSHIIAFVHLPSKMYDNEEKNRRILERITLKINELDGSKNRKILIFGDFNLNPYEKPMIYFTGCNAVFSKDTAMKIYKGRDSKDDKFYYYYNPMWRFIGDNNLGTYYYSKTSMHSIYWNTFDQFVVSPELIKDIKDIKIIKNAGTESLFNKNGIPNVSDHFPLFFKLGGS